MGIAKGRYYLLLNSDAEILEDAMERLVKYADQHANAGITGCTILSPDGSQQASLLETVYTCLFACSFGWALPHIARWLVWIYESK